MRALRKEAATLNPDLRRKIGEGLRATYAEMLREPILGRQLDLLQRFEGDEADVETLVKGRACGGPRET
jgi:hypothetical protein